MSKKIKLSKLIPDDRNNNKHTAYGMDLLEKSINKVGIIESITISNDDKIISGNARHEIIGKNFDKEALVIETDGTQPIIIKRTDIESDTKQFYEASILANTTSKKNIDYDNKIIEEIEIDYSIDATELGYEEKITRMQNNSNFHTKDNHTEDLQMPENFPITIIQTKEEYDIFCYIKQKLNIKSSIKAFTEIINIVKESI
jgi:hypothetical protein